MTPRRPLPTLALLSERSAGAASAAYRSLATRCDDEACTEARAVAEVLQEIGVDADSEIAALWLHAPEGALVGQPTPEVAALVAGHRRAGKAMAVWQNKPARSSAEPIRRLLLILAGDVRVVLILLAEQLVRLRALRHGDPTAREAAARMTFDLHAPLASRLGLAQVKWELEDLSFRFLKPEAYQQLKAELDERREERERYIAEVVATLRQALAEAGVQAEVSGRPKHLFSIWKKMNRKGLDLSEIYDVRAVRVLTEDVASCYAALGVVHGAWPHIPKEFDDYIAQPKGNDYRSLHTAVTGPQGKTLEVQIRTREMHLNAEHGVAAHWRYKEGAAGRTGDFEARLAQIRQLLESRDEGDNSALIGGLATGLLEDRVYLLTPGGDVVDLPAGATVLDFAYTLHSHIGHATTGARVDGRIVPLSHRPATGATVEILTQKGQAPRRDWLQPQSGFLTTARARQKVRAWFNRMAHDENVATGRTLLERELRRAGLAEVDLEALARRVELAGVDELAIKLALGNLGLQPVLRAARDLVGRGAAEAPAAAEPQPRKESATRRDAVVIDGVDNVLLQLARCCRPLPGDTITGYISRGRGIGVHRAECRSLADLLRREPDRAIEVAWGQTEAGRFAARLAVRARDRQGIVRDIGAVIANEKLDLVELKSRRIARGVALIEATVEIGGRGDLHRLLERLSEVPGALTVARG